MGEDSVSVKSNNAAVVVIVVVPIISSIVNCKRLQLELESIFLEIYISPLIA